MKVTQFFYMKTNTRGNCQSKQCPSCQGVTYAQRLEGQLLVIFVKILFLLPVISKIKQLCKKLFYLKTTPVPEMCIFSKVPKTGCEKKICFQQQPINPLRYTHTFTYTIVCVSMCIMSEHTRAHAKTHNAYKYKLTSW